MEPVSKKQRIEALVRPQPWSKRRKKPLPPLTKAPITTTKGVPVAITQEENKHTIFESLSRAVTDEFPSHALDPATSQQIPTIPISSTFTTIHGTSVSSAPITPIYDTTQTNPTRTPPKSPALDTPPPLPTLQALTPTTPIPYTLLPAPLPTTVPPPLPLQTLLPTEAGQDISDVDCSVDDLVAGNTLEQDGKDTTSSTPTSAHSPASTATSSKHDNETPTHTSTTSTTTTTSTSTPRSAGHTSDSKLIRHLECVMQNGLGQEMKLKMSTIAEGLNVSEYKGFLMSAFSSSMAVLSDKDLRKKEAELRKRKPSPIDYVEEIRSMMHGFGDVAHALKESAQFLELLTCKYLSLVLKLVAEVLPKSKLSEIPVEVIAVAMLPDLKKVSKIQQWILFISQGRKFTHATEASKGPEGTGGTTDDNYTPMGVQTLEIISDEAKAKPKVAPDEGLTTLFSSSLWQEQLEKAREEVRLEKLTRAAARDKLSRSIPLADYEYYEECSKANFTKPNKRSKFEQFMQVRCMPDLSVPPSFLSFSPLALDVLGMLAREFVEEIIVGALEKRVGTQKKSLEPIDILMYLKGVSPTPT